MRTLIFPTTPKGKEKERERLFGREMKFHSRASLSLSTVTLLALMEQKILWQCTRKRVTVQKKLVTVTALGNVHSCGGVDAL